MLSNQYKLCPKCNKSRETYFVTEKDPKKRGKYWQIERCPTCAFNFEIEEAPGALAKREPKIKTDIEDDGSGYGRPRGGWIV